MKASYNYLFGFQLQADVLDIAENDRRELLFVLLQDASLDLLRTIQSDLPRMIDYNLRIQQDG